MGWGIKARLFLSMLILGVLPLILSGIASYSITRRASIEAARDELRGIPGPAGRRLEEMLYFRWNDTLFLSRLPLLTGEGDPEQKSAYLKEVLQTYAPYSWLGVTDAAGRIIAATTDASLGQEVSGEVWYQKARAIAPHRPARAAIHLQDSYFSKLSGGLPVVGFSAPLYDPQERFRGVVRTEVKLSFVAENIQNLRAGRSGSALLVNRDGQVLADRTGVALGQGLLLPWQAPFWRTRSGRSGILWEKDTRGEQVLVSFAPLRGFAHYPGLGWSLLVFQPAEEVYAAARKQARLFAGVTLAGVAAILLGGYLLLERWISRPLGQLCTLAERIGAGELEQRVEIRQGGEIGGLAVSLDRMAGNLKALQERLVQATLREFSFEIAHELGNPLAALRVGAQVLEEELEPHSPHMELVKRLIAETGRIDHLLKIFISFARPQKPSPVPCDLREILEEVLALIQSLARQGISICREYAPSLPRVNADPTQMHQALLGLVWKMAQEMPPGGELRVKLTMGANPADLPIITLSLSCAGQAIPPAQLQRIFSPLFDVKAQTSGLSLAFSRQIIEQHGGKLWVESEAGEGSTFTLYLPGLPSNSLVSNGHPLPS
ncbi:MAG: HAMP domain-containing protein [Candidatus Tectomicrobia bacterium]|uniref:histidine kinase n=1 Tax=Tectimicrobiota bacterium TaxID=2528274 RepID=A0A932G0X5_UNCTE|nr:HAMP domain-containing protein [Candidatus Tectomicrobia bacterium]